MFGPPHKCPSCRELTYGKDRLCAHCFFAHTTEGQKMDAGFSEILTHLAGDEAIPPPLTFREEATPMGN